MKLLIILRLGHRIPRDERISTHCALVGRAFGADCLYYSGMKDGGFEQSVSDVVNNFGGDFFVEHAPDGARFVKQKKEEGFFVVHLTMYGIDFRKRIRGVREKEKVLVIIGGEKVDAEFYELADINLAIGKQPHSEVGALAVFLNECFGLKENFKNAKLRVRECERGKDVLRL